MIHASDLADAICTKLRIRRRMRGKSYLDKREMQSVLNWLIVNENAVNAILDKAEAGRAEEESQS